MDKPVFRVLDLAMAPPTASGRGPRRGGGEAGGGRPPAEPPLPLPAGPLAEKALAALPRPCGGGRARAGARGGGVERETEATPSRRAWLPKRVRDVFPVRGKHQIEVNKQRE